MCNTNNLFLKTDDISLYTDMVLVEYKSPILFTCIDDNQNMYIVSCFREDGYEKAWLIASITPNQVIQLLSNETSIRDIFPIGSTSIYLAKQFRNKDISIQCCKADDVPSLFFPTPDMYLDASEDEFVDEVVILHRRMHQFNY